MQSKNETFKDQYEEFVAPNLEAFQKAFNLSPDIMNQFSYLYGVLLTDYLLAENFEGNPPRYKFRPDQWYGIKNIMFNYITVPYAPDQQVYVSKLLRKPLQIISEKVDRIINGKE